MNIEEWSRKCSISHGDMKCDLLTLLLPGPQSELVGALLGGSDPFHQPHLCLVPTQLVASAPFKLVKAAPFACLASWQTPEF